jgi:hypothetical protein
VKEPGAFDQLTHYSEVPSVEEMTSIRMYIAAARKEVEALAEKGSELVKANFSAGTFTLNRGPGTRPGK